MKLNFKEEMNFVKRTTNNKSVEVSSARKSLNTLRKYVMHLKKYFNEDENIRNIIYQEFIADTYDYLKVAGTENFDPSGGVIANERQRNAIKMAIENLYEAKSALDMGLTLDAVTVSLQETIDCLLELTGEKASEEIVDSVFHNFCVGK